MNWNLPVTVEIDGEEYKIRNKCDYRVVLDCISALNDNELTKQEKIQASLFIFYEDLSGCKDIKKAVAEMFSIINNGENDDESNKAPKPKLMDWEHDFKVLVSPINRVLGYEVRSAEYLHWHTFLGAYYEIGECQFQTIVSIRSKRAKGKKLDEWEREYYKENKKMIDLPMNLTEDEREWLDEEW